MPGGKDLSPCTNERTVGGDAEEKREWSEGQRRVFEGCLDSEAEAAGSTTAKLEEERKASPAGLRKFECESLRSSSGSLFLTRYL